VDVLFQELKMMRMFSIVQVLLTASHAMVDPLMMTVLNSLGCETPMPRVLVYCLQTRMYLTDQVILGLYHDLVVQTMKTTLI
jgi:hypothetical protein